eukprot:4399283-Prymnesium_polylepis.1
MRARPPSSACSARSTAAALVISPDECSSSSSRRATCRYQPPAVASNRSPVPHGRSAAAAAAVLPCWCAWPRALAASAAQPQHFLGVLPSLWPCTRSSSDAPSPAASPVPRLQYPGVSEPMPRSTNSPRPTMLSSSMPPVPCAASSSRALQPSTTPLPVAAPALPAGMPSGSRGSRWHPMPWMGSMQPCGACGGPIIAMPASSVCPYWQHNRTPSARRLVAACSGSPLPP